MPTDPDLVEEVAALRRQLSVLEGRLEEQPQSTRRGLLRLAGAAVVGGAAAALGSTPAAASTGAMNYGTSMNAGADETSLTSSSIAWTFQATNTNNSGSAALRGIGTAGAHGVYGRNDSSDINAGGVFGGSTTSQGYGVVAGGGKAQLYLQSAVNMGPSSTGTQHNVGEIAYDDDTDALWTCVTGGSTGTWRKIAGAATAGAFHAISPARAYDSRKSIPGPQAVLATGDSRTVSVANKYSTGAITGLLQSNVVPAGATAVAYNITVVNTVGSNGFLAVNEGGNTTVAASIINWSASGLVLANSSVVKLNGSRQITVICGGTGTSCNFIIDTLGYYL